MSMLQLEIPSSLGSSSNPQPPNSATTPRFIKTDHFENWAALNVADFDLPSLDADDAILRQDDFLLKDNVKREEALLSSVAFQEHNLDDAFSASSIDMMGNSDMASASMTDLSSLSGGAGNNNSNSGDGSGNHGQNGSGENVVGLLDNMLVRDSYDNTFSSDSLVSLSSSVSSVVSTPLYQPLNNNSTGEYAESAALTRTLANTPFFVDSNGRSVSPAPAASPVPSGSAAAAAALAIHTQGPNIPPSIRMMAGAGSNKGNKMWQPAIPSSINLASAQHQNVYTAMSSPGGSSCVTPNDIDGNMPPRGYVFDQQPDGNSMGTQQMQPPQQFAIPYTGLSVPMPPDHYYQLQQQQQQLLLKHQQQQAMAHLQPPPPKINKRGRPRTKHLQVPANSKNGGGGSSNNVNVTGNNVDGEGSGSDPSSPVIGGAMAMANAAVLARQPHSCRRPVGKRGTIPSKRRDLLESYDSDSSNLDLPTLLQEQEQYLLQQRPQSTGGNSTDSNEEPVYYAGGGGKHPPKQFLQQQRQSIYGSDAFVPAGSSSSTGPYVAGFEYYDEDKNEYAPNDDAQVPQSGVKQQRKRRGKASGRFPAEEYDVNEDDELDDEGDDEGGEEDDDEDDDDDEEGDEDEDDASSTGSGRRSRRKMTGVRKVSHNEMERRRRKELRVEFQRLRQHVPSVAHDKAAKIIILAETTDYIDGLSDKVATGQASISKLRKERDMLLRQLSQQ